jgi:hypothetical protein
MIAVEHLTGTLNPPDSLGTRSVVVGSSACSTGTRLTKTPRAVTLTPAELMLTSIAGVVRLARYLGWGRVSLDQNGLAENCSITYSMSNLGFTFNYLAIDIKVPLPDLPLCCQASFGRSAEHCANASLKPPSGWSAGRCSLRVQHRPAAA